MLTWPHANSDWAPYLSAVEPVFVAIGEAVTRHQKLLVVCNDDVLRTRVRDLLHAAGADLTRVTLTVAPSNDTWTRDHGPITAHDHNNNLVLLDFEFNGWGGKYHANLDNEITSRLHVQGLWGEASLVKPGLILEGGSIELDGQGTLLTTTRCLLAATRNAHVSRTELETHLHEWLGVDRFLWLEHGALEGDDTDSHIDTLARFCDPQTIAYVQCTDPQDPHFAALHAMEQELRAFRQRNGAAYRLIPLPWPRAVTNEQGDRLPATYANFLIINHAVLVPTYHDPADNDALTALQRAFPNRKVIGIPCRPLVYQYGSLHCVTMQLPQGLL
jgi:agmatine deiminase